MSRVSLPVPGKKKGERGLRRGSEVLPEDPGAGLWENILQTVVPRGTERCREFIPGEVMTSS